MTRYQAVVGWDLNVVNFRAKSDKKAKSYADSNFFELSELQNLTTGKFIVKEQET